MNDCFFMRYFLIFFLVPISLHAQRYNNAESYLKFVDGHHATVIEQTWNFMYTYTQESDQTKVKGQRKKLENILNKSLRYIEKEDAFDIEYQQATIKYLKGNIAIVNKDYVTLLKTDAKKAPAINKNIILKKIRKAMYQLRSDYDTAVNLYGIRHDLIVKSNNNNLAKQMSHTIKVYDYYYELSVLINHLKNTEAYLWKEVTSLKVEQFNQRLEALKNVINDNNIIASQLIKPSINNNLQEGFLEFQKAFGVSFEEKTKPIQAILQAYSTNDRTNIVEKTTAFNKAKNWFNDNRREAYKLWSTSTQDYLRSEIKPL